MELRAAKLEASDDVVDNPRESAKITSRARSRIAELLQKPFDVRSICFFQEIPSKDTSHSATNDKNVH